MRSSTSPPPALQLADHASAIPYRYIAITNGIHVYTRLASEPTVCWPYEKMSGTSVKISKNEVECRDDTVPKTVETRRHCEED